MVSNWVENLGVPLITVGKYSNSVRSPLVGFHKGKALREAMDSTILILLWALVQVIPWAYK
jgi:hypothetical protein